MLSSRMKFDSLSCHYEGPNGDISLGKKCGNEVEDLMATGVDLDGTNYEVHCHGH